MAQDQFSITINKETLSKMVDNILVDSLPNKKLMSNYLTRIISRGNNGNDFFMALTDTFPKIYFNRGDTVRILRKSLYYSIDDQKSIEAGYINGDGIYVKITGTDYTCRDCYTGTVTFIDLPGNITTRELEFNNDIILMDNTIQVSLPDILPANLI